MLAISFSMVGYNSYVAREAFGVPSVIAKKFMYPLLACNEMYSLYYAVNGAGIRIIGKYVAQMY